MSFLMLLLLHFALLLWLMLLTMTNLLLLRGLLPFLLQWAVRILLLLLHLR